MLVSDDFDTLLTDLLSATGRLPDATEDLPWVFDGLVSELLLTVFTGLSRETLFFSGCQLSFLLSVEAGAVAFVADTVLRFTVLSELMLLLSLLTAGASFLLVAIGFVPVLLPLIVLVLFSGLLPDEVAVDTDDIVLRLVSESPIFLSPVLELPELVVIVL